MARGAAKSSFLPTQHEIERKLVEDMCHSYRVEYYLYKLLCFPQFSAFAGFPDDQRPHDIAGLNNKLEWDVLYGLALERRAVKHELTQAEKEALKSLVWASVNFHRGQNHHLIFNGRRDRVPLARRDYEDFVGGVDMLVALNEGRWYVGTRDFEASMQLVLDEGNPHKIAAVQSVIKPMAQLPQPLAQYSIRGVPDVACLRPGDVEFPWETYEGMYAALKGCVQKLSDRGYEINLPALRGAYLLGSGRSAGSSLQEAQV